jgi:hypothetical protein
VVQKDKEGFCCSSRRLIGHQGAFARLQASGAGIVQEPTGSTAAATAPPTRALDHRPHTHDLRPRPRRLGRRCNYVCGVPWSARW